MAACVKPGESMAQLDGNDKTVLEEEMARVESDSFFYMKIKTNYKQIFTFRQRHESFF